MLLLFIIYIVNLHVVRPRSCRVIYYFDTPALKRRHQAFGRVTPLVLLGTNSKKGPLNKVCKHPTKKNESKKQPHRRCRLLNQKRRNFLLLIARSTTTQFFVANCKVDSDTVFVVDCWIDNNKIFVATNWIKSNAIFRS